MSILPGISYQSEMVFRDDSEPFTAVTIMIDLNRPEVSLIQPEPQLADSSMSGHFKLNFPDILIEKYDLDILLSTTPFHSERDDDQKTKETYSGIRGKQESFSGWAGYPGRSVWVTQPIITEGVASHLPNRCHLFWLDNSKQLHITEGIQKDQLVELVKPENMHGIKYGFGVEAVHIQHGQIKKPFKNPFYTSDRINYRPFIGIDPEENLLFLLAFENATTFEMLDYAIQQGVKIGGQLDAGNTTWLIFGNKTKKLFPHSGVRGGRTIAGFLGVRTTEALTISQ